MQRLIFSPYLFLPLHCIYPTKLWWCSSNDILSKKSTLYNGVIPQHYPNSFDDLIKLLCVHKVDSEVIFKGRQSGRLLCTNCLDTWTFPIHENIIVINSYHEVMVYYQVKSRYHLCQTRLTVRQLTCYTGCMDLYFIYRDKNHSWTSCFLLIYVFICSFYYYFFYRIFVPDESKQCKTWRVLY